MVHVELEIGHPPETLTPLALKSHHGVAQAEFGQIGCGCLTATRQIQRPAYGFGERHLCRSRDVADIATIEPAIGSVNCIARGYIRTAPDPAGLVVLREAQGKSVFLRIEYQNARFDKFDDCGRNPAL